jgi:hypothetical protein
MGDGAHVVPCDHIQRWDLAAGGRKVFVVAALLLCMNYYFETLLAQNGEREAP